LNKIIPDIIITPPIIVDNLGISPSIIIPKIVASTGVANIKEVTSVVLFASSKALVQKK
jgi:hypothetical protein